MTRWRVAGINFAHHHMGDNLRHVAAHPDAELVGICDETPADRMLEPAAAADEFDLPADRVFEDSRTCLAETDPDIVVCCPVPADHAEWVERIAPYGPAVLLEKPFALSVAQADRMIAAMDDTGAPLAINWPMAWYPTHRTTKRLIDEGAIGAVEEVHYYGGNAGMGRARSAEFAPDQDLHVAGRGHEDRDRLTQTWWHDPDRGGGSLVDYLGYGVTLGTWFRDGELPNSVSTRTFSPEWTPVDTQSLTVARYETGLSKYETKWGAFSDPWIHQPQPKCGFVVVGTEGTIASYDDEDAVRLQDRTHPEGQDIPVDTLEPPRQNPVQYLIHCLESGDPVSFGPLSPGLCRDAQRIMDAARRSAERDEPVALPA